MPIPGDAASGSPIAAVLSDMQARLDRLPHDFATSASFCRPTSAPQRRSGRLSREDTSKTRAGSSAGTSPSPSCT